MNEYTPPDTHNIVFNFTGETYTPPDAFNVILDFGTSNSKTNYITVLGSIYTEFGNTNIKPTIATIHPVSFDSFRYGGQKVLLLSKFLYVNGFNALSVGKPSVVNYNKNLNPLSFYAQIFGSALKVYNLRQYLTLNPSRGFDAVRYGTAFFQGGVKYLNAFGLSAGILPSPTVINTKADQFVNLSGKGILPPNIPVPLVSPRILYLLGIRSDAYGQPLVQRNPSPLGFVNTGYGVAWVSHSPRYLQPFDVEAFLVGIPRVFDPIQYVRSITVIAGGVFGDIAIRNIKRFLSVKGFDAHWSGDWSVVASNRRSIALLGFASQVFGELGIQNKTPSIAPIGFDGLQGLQLSIGYWVREVKPSGWYQPKFGTHQFTKTPELKSSGFNSGVFGSTFISNRIRYLYAGLGRDSLEFGDDTVWHYVRYLKADGVESGFYGTPRVEHGRRALLMQGAIHSVYGVHAWVSHAVRWLAPTSIDYPKIPIHYVGRHQEVLPVGFVATLFGSRIIPESQSIYPQGFVNPFGLVVVDWWKKHIKPTGFLSTNQEGGHRFGTAQFWNLRQYVVQFFDGDSGLVPPKWVGWTAVENRNKTIGAMGGDAARFAEPYVENKARPVLPTGFDATAIGQLMVADWIRYLKLQGMEAPYIGGWSVVYHDARVLVPQGFNVQAFGMASVGNTRRYFPRVGNFESLEMGVPMVADRIRTLMFEPRYTIAPPSVPLPIVDLYTRYIEEVGRFDDYQVFGNPSLSIHWRIVTPRWTHRDYLGEPRLHNVTPELATRGRNTEEFGQASVRTQWRELLHKGSESVAWGKLEVAFRDRSVALVGFTQWAIPIHKVIKTGIPPYFPQYIWLDSVEMDGEGKRGHGIEPPPSLVRQVSRPSLRTNVLQPFSFVATEYGDHDTQSNGILVQPGLQELTVGSPVVDLKNRMLVVDSLGDCMVVSKPRVSPHTIWATAAAPEQAKKNHPESRMFEPINYHNGLHPVGEIFGRAVISLQHRQLNRMGVGNQSRWGDTHKIELRKRYVNLTDFGFRSQRMGFHVVGPFDQMVMQFDSDDMQLFGQVSLSIPYGGAFYIQPSGLAVPTISMAVVDFLHRSIQPMGFDAAMYGVNAPKDKPFMWQGVRIGELVKGNYGGFASEVFGQTRISNWIREVGVKGFDAFVCEYDYTNFNERLRVIAQVLPRPQISVMALGFDISVMGVPNINPAVHYIRPDGHADQFRKGAF